LKELINVNTVPLVFPIRGKILKPKFLAAEQKKQENLFFPGFEMNAILSDKNSISL